MDGSASPWLAPTEKPPLPRICAHSGTTDAREVVVPRTDHRWLVVVGARGRQHDRFGGEVVEPCPDHRGYVDPNSAAITRTSRMSSHRGRSTRMLPCRQTRAVRCPGGRVRRARMVLRCRTYKRCGEYRKGRPSSASKAAESPRVLVVGISTVRAPEVSPYSLSLSYAPARVTPVGRKSLGLRVREGGGRRGWNLPSILIRAVAVAGIRRSKRACRHSPRSRRQCGKRVGS